MTTLRPIENRVIVRPDDPPSQSKGGILLPEQAKERPRRGTVLSTGLGKSENGGYRPCFVNQGDVVVFSPYSTNIVEHEGEELYAILDTDIIAVVDGAKTPTAG